MSKPTEHVITYAGIGQAVEVLHRAGMLDIMAEPANTQAGLVILNTKATTYLRLSREKGEARSHEELDAAYLIACLKLWLDGYIKLVNAAEA